MIGYAFCGSFCTLSKSFLIFQKLISRGENVLPIVSENVYSTDTRFGKASEFCNSLESASGNKPIHTFFDAEPLGPKIALDALIICPCTGNTLAKLANGITDTAVTMAAKAHLRQDRPLLIATASNDAMSANLSNIGTLLCRRAISFVPMRQDDPLKKPHSLVADFSLICEAYRRIRSGAVPAQMRPLFLA